MQQHDGRIRTLGVHRQRPDLIIVPDALAKLDVKSLEGSFNSCEKQILLSARLQIPLRNLLDNITFSVVSKARFEWKFHRNSDHKNDLGVRWNN